MSMAAQGPIGLLSSPMTSSMIVRVTSGTRAMTAIPASEDPSASSTFALYRQVYAASRLPQPCFPPASVSAAATSSLPVDPVLPQAPTPRPADFIPQQQSNGFARRRATPRGRPGQGASNSYSRT